VNNATSQVYAVFGTRSSDVYGQAIGAACRPTFVWCDNVWLDNAMGGTYVSVQTGGPALC
jgi:hypothetical protein